MTRFAGKEDELIITDLKTGTQPATGGDIREETTIQLKLYAYLIHENFNEWPELEVQPLQGDSVPLACPAEEIESLAVELKSRLQSVNALIASALTDAKHEPLLASPTPSNCRLCSFRLSCEAYWDARDTWDAEMRPPDLSGKLIAIKPQSSELLLLEIELPEGVSSVRGFSTSMVRGEGSLQSGTRLRLCELWHERAPRTYSCRAITVALLEP